MRLNFYICTVQSLKYMLFNQFGHNYVVGLTLNNILNQLLLHVHYGEI